MNADSESKCIENMNIKELNELKANLQAYVNE